MKIIALTLSVFIYTGSYGIDSDSQAYDFCVSNPLSFIAIVWPQAQGKDDKIEKILRKYGELKYKKMVQFTYDQAFALLKDAHPHISDMHNHMKLYFPSGTLKKSARIYLITFANLQTAVQCKHEIRHIFNMGYISIHMNDYHHEVLKLAEFFFNAQGMRSALKDIESN